MCEDQDSYRRTHTSECSKKSNTEKAQLQVRLKFSQTINKEFNQKEVSSYQ